MDVLLQTIAQPLYNHGAHKGFLVKWKLVAPLVKKWSKNRDPDQERVNEMKQHHQAGGYLPNHIHLAELPGEGLVCYDGNHRRMVFNDFPDVLCVIDVIFMASESQIYNEFEYINKAVQVPALYLPTTTPVPKDDIIALVKTYEQKYKSFLSTSARCHAPHFNRDMFVDNVHEIYQQFQGTLSVSELGVLLNKLNQAYSNELLCRPHRFYRDTVLDKCKKHDFWLFIDRFIPFEHVKRIHDGKHLLIE